MDLKDYINKNLPNLNWNLLPQIFEENEVELTDEIKAYLKETPENTNWNILNGMSESGGSDEITVVIVKSGEDESVFGEESTIKTAKDLLEAAYADENLTISLKFAWFEGVATQFKHTEENVRWCYDDADYYVSVGLDSNGYYIQAWQDTE